MRPRIYNTKPEKIHTEDDYNSIKTYLDKLLSCEIYVKLDQDNFEDLRKCVQTRKRRKLVFTFYFSNFPNPLLGRTLGHRQLTLHWWKRLRDSQIFDNTQFYTFLNRKIETFLRHILKHISDLILTYLTNTFL